MFDSLPASLAGDSTLWATWEDSIRREGDWRNLVQGTTALREGASRRNLSTRGQQGEGAFSWNLQLSSPGGLRRRRLAGRIGSATLALGDLAPWRDHPLLEGTSLVVGRRDTSMARQIAYGSGTRANGVEFDGAWGDLRILARQRVERGTSSPRWATALSIGFGAATLGCRVSDTGGSADPVPVASAGWKQAGMQGEVAVLDPVGASATAVHFQAAKEFSPVQVDFRFRNLSRGFRHSGVSKRWSEGAWGSLGLKGLLPAGLRLSNRTEGSRDSAGKVGARTMAALRLGRPLFELEAGASLSENLSATPRWSVGSRGELTVPGLAPRIEGTYADSAGTRVGSVKVELAARRTNQELSLSGTTRTIGGSRWSVRHTARLVEPWGSLEFSLSLGAVVRASTQIVSEAGATWAW